MSRSRVVGVASALALAATTSIALGGSGLKTASETETVANEETRSVTATCPRGRRVVSGGFAADFGSGPMYTLLLVTTSRRVGARTWQTTATNDGEAGDLTTNAYCRDQRLRRASKRVEFPSGSTGSVTVRCPGDRSAISGGYTMPPEDFVGDTPVFRNSASRRVGPDRWRVSTFNNGNETGDVTAYVYCRGGPTPRIRRKTRDLDDGGSSVVTPIKARCRRGERVLAGGFASPAPGKEAAEILASRKRGSRTWLVRARTGGLGAPVAVTAYAYCEEKR